MTSFTFRVRATGDAHVGLSPMYGDAAQMYEIGEYFAITFLAAN